MNSTQPSLRYLRYAVQGLFMLITLWIGYEFYHFVLHFEKPGHPFVERPPSVDAFLPISGLMAVKFYLFTGTIEPVHPAGFFLFLAIVFSSLLLKKGFCGWICPVSTLSQLIWMGGEKIFGKRFIKRISMNFNIDLALRSLKYLLLFIFILLIGVVMTPNMMVLFFLADYYKTVDVKMMHFFTDMSTVTLWTLVVLGVLSLFYKNFWCRYLCPYGALLGLASMISPAKITRHDKKCSHCHTCSTNCPTYLDVEKEDVVSSPECFGCMTCISRCPSPGALEMSVKIGPKNRKRLNAYLFPTLLVIVFYALVCLGMATDNWQSKVSYEDYQRIIPTIGTKESPADKSDVNQ